MRGRPPNTDAEMEEDIRREFPDEEGTAILSCYYSLRRKGMEPDKAAVQSLFAALDKHRRDLRSLIAEINEIVARN